VSPPRFSEDSWSATVRGKPSGSPSAAPTGGIIGGLCEALFGVPSEPKPPTRSERALSATRLAIQITVRLCLIVLLVAATIAVSVWLLRLA